MIKSQVIRHTQLHIIRDFRENMHVEIKVMFV